ncbi:hypothetical protein XCR_1291 [Xanthomonas campestris pv. raphani 756C]|nr:hypothetical protein XCR_1291 [Xanthomonas campestris pv. raphani 756C]
MNGTRPFAYRCVKPTGTAPVARVVRCHQHPVLKITAAIPI